MPAKGNIFIITKNILLTIIAAIIGAVGMHVFVYPLALAPMGIDGIATMLQYVTNINAGYFTALINLPIMFFAWFILDKGRVIYTVLFTLITSGMLIFLQEINFYQFSSENDTLISVLCAGIILGARTGIMLLIGGASGGIDITAAILLKKYPFLKIERVITIICDVITVASYFVYRDFMCIILAIFMNIVFEYVVNYMMRVNRNAVEIKVITDKPDEIIDEILKEFKHGGYSIEGKGIFSGDEKTIISSVINTRQIPDLMKMCRKYPGSFAYYSSVDGIIGNFRWHKTDEVR